MNYGRNRSPVQLPIELLHEPQQLLQPSRLQPAWLRTADDTTPVRQEGQDRAHLQAMTS